MTDLRTSPKDMKKAINQRIRAALIMLGSATKAELCQRLGISFPTISKFLAQMEEDGEIRYAGEDDSSGGRRARRYAYDPEFMLGLAVFIAEHETTYAIFDCVGEIKEEGTTASVVRQGSQQLADHIEALIEKYPKLRSIAIGVPGAVNNGQIIFMPPYPHFLDDDLKGIIESRFQLPVVVENDMNAAVLGFASHMEIENESLVYLYFGENGPGSGIMINGDVVRGSTFFAGEVSFVPQYDERTFGRSLRQEGPDCKPGDAQIDAVARLIATFAAIINPRAVVFCSDEVDEALLARIAERGANYIPRDHLPMLTISDRRQDYLNGLQHLALDAMIGGTESI